MANPVICRVTRGRLVESVHRGAFAVVDAAGRLVDHGGDVETPRFARSALKAMQALPLVESGAADAFRLTPRQLAVATASHSGEPEHVRQVRAMLEAAGLDEASLGCGPQCPRDREVALALAQKGGAAGRIHNNCSGKHAGFLLASRHLGLPAAGYLDPDQPVQATVRRIIAELTGAATEGDVASVDGCSAPTYAVPLRGLAHAFARLGTGTGLSPERAAAARRILGAAMAEPWFVAGTGRACTAVMETGRRRVYAKTGAEGVYVAALPADGLGVALKCDDGAGRASEALLAALLARHLGDAPATVRDGLSLIARRPVRDFNDRVVGEIRAVLPEGSGAPVPGWTHTAATDG